MTILASTNSDLAGSNKHRPFIGRACQARARLYFAIVLPVFFLAAFLLLTPGPLYAVGSVKTKAAAPTPAPVSKPGPVSSTAVEAPPTSKGAPASGSTPAGSAATSKEASAAGSAIDVAVPAGKYLVWLRQGDVVGPPELTANGHATLVLPAKGKTEIWVDNAGTDELAIVPAKTPLTTVTTADFTDHFISRLVAHVLDKASKPLGTGMVVYRDAAGRSQTETLTPGSQGDAIFSNVAAPGKVIVTAPGGATLNSTDIPVDFGGTGSSTIIISTAAASALPAVAPAAAPVKRPHHLAAPVKKVASGGSALPYVILALLVLAGLVYLGLVLSRDPRFREMAEEKLKLLGVHLTPQEEPGAAAAAPGARAGRAAAAATDPSICQFCGTRKDSTTGSCACTLVPAGVGSGDPAPISASLAAGPRLVTLDGPARGQIFHLNGDTTIGRDTTNTIPLAADTAVSRHHARFTSSEGLVEVVDEGSSNGTFVNGSRVNRQPLQPSDEIQIGHSRFRYEVS